MTACLISLVSHEEAARSDPYTTCVTLLSVMGTRQIRQDAGALHQLETSFSAPCWPRNDRRGCRGVARCRPNQRSFHRRNEYRLPGARQKTKVLSARRRANRRGGSTDEGTEPEAQPAPRRGEGERAEGVLILGGWPPDVAMITGVGPARRATPTVRIKNRTVRRRRLAWDGVETTTAQPALVSDQERLELRRAPHQAGESDSHEEHLRTGTRSRASDQRLKRLPTASDRG